MNNLTQRLLTALVLMPITLFILWLGHPYSTGAFALIFLAALAELYMITQRLHPSVQTIFFLLGFCYVGLAFQGLRTVIQFEPASYLVIFLTLLVWASDTGAFLVGKLVGGPKLAPSISPGKTWSGSIGGLLMTTIVVLSFDYLACKINIHEHLQAMYIGIFVSVIVQLGDLGESAFKRFLEIKDSGRLIPGHGGIWDRLDGYIALFAAIGVATLFIPLAKLMSMMGISFL